MVSLIAIPSLGAQTDGLVYSEDTVVTVSEGVVLVETTATLRNTTRDRVENGTVFYSFFDSLPLVVPVGAENLTVISGDSTLASSNLALDEDFEIREYALPSQLRSGQTRTVSISFELPTGGLRSDGLFLSNPAYSSFPLWSSSDPGQGSIQLRILEEAKLNDIGNSLRFIERTDGFAIYEPTNFALPRDLFAYVVVTDESELEQRNIEVLGQDIEINYWPGDHVWANFADRTITSGLPALEAQIGFEVPDQQTLEVNESATPYFFGYGGWYDEVETSIDIGNLLDETVMIHELSHAWFNSELFLDRWISEGLAEDFTWRTQGELGSAQEETPGLPQLTDRASLPLAQWTSAGIGVTNSEEFQDQERYAYEASWYVVREIIETIGVDDMQAVIGVAEENRHAYSASNTLPVRFGEDWRRFLDLVSDHATPEEQEQIEALFTEYIVTEQDSLDFEARRQARIDFELLVEREPGWGIPLALRNAMATWDFEAAGSFLERARPIQDRYLQLEAALAGTSLEVSNAAREAYEEGPDEWDRAIELLDQQFFSVERLALVEQSVSVSPSITQTVGLWGVDSSTLLDEAGDALANDDFRSVNTATAELENSLQNAERRGILRIAGAAILLALILIIPIARRKKRVTEERSLPDEEPVDDGLREALGLLQSAEQKPAESSDFQDGDVRDDEIEDDQGDEVAA